ncbi:MAG: CBS domain-containing protein [Nitrospirae bacterium]|nr:MAG: CBS domain-containing protein [Nitrospirota bacterium]
MRKTPVKKIYTTDVISVSPLMPLADAALLMGRHKISCIIAVENKKPVGIFTERDFIRAIHGSKGLGGLTVSDIMRSPVIKASADANLYEAYDLIETNGIRHLVIVDSKDRLAGVATQTDIMRHLGMESFIEVKDISKIMTKNVVTVQKNGTLEEVLSKMISYSISCVVVEEKMRPAGILTERDIVRLYNEGIDTSTIRAGDVMRSPVETIQIKMPVHKAVSIMNHKKIRRLIVADQRKKIVGIVTQTDVIRRVEERYIEFLKELMSTKEELLHENIKILSEKVVLDNLLRSSSETAILALDADFRILYYNTATEKIFVWDKGDLTGQKITELYSNVIDPGFSTRRVQQETVAEGMFRDIVELDGKHIESTITGIRDDKNEVVGYVVLARDITEYKQLEEESVKAQKLESVSILAGGLAHDFNNLITGILNCLSLAKSMLYPEHNAYESLLMAEKAAHIAGDLTHQLTTFSRIGHPDIKPVTLSEIPMDAACLLPQGFKAKCEFSVPNDLWPVNADETQILRVFNNLTLNAAEAMPEGGPVTVTAKNITVKHRDGLPIPHGRYVRISIRDTGTGIKKKNLSKIFDPYFSTKHRAKTRGAGLGLAISYAIIRNHDGHIAVESEENKGSTFHVYLPAAGKQPEKGLRK